MSSTININHEAAKMNAAKLQDVADTLESSRKALRANVVEELPDVFCSGDSATVGNDPASLYITGRIARELESLDKITKQLRDVADKMIQISKTLEVSQGGGEAGEGGEKNYC